MLPEIRKLPLSLSSTPKPVVLQAVAGLEFPLAYHEVPVPANQYEAGLDNLPAYRIWQSPGLPDLLPDYCRLSHKVRGTINRRILTNKSPPEKREASFASMSVTESMVIIHQ